jgi:hypothetical protein
MNPTCREKPGQELPLAMQTWPMFLTFSLSLSDRVLVCSPSLLGLQVCPTNPAVLYF